MWILPLLMTAQAGTPTRVAWTDEVGTAVSDLDVTSDGRWVAFIEKSTGQVRFLDTWSWQVDDAVAPCGDALATSLAMWELSGETKLYVGCDDSTVVWMALNDGVFEKFAEFVSLNAGPVLGVAESNGAILIIADQLTEGANPEVHHLDPTDSGVDATGSYPQALGFSGLKDVEASDSIAILGHVGDSVSRVDVGTGYPTIRQQTQSQLDVVDVIYTSYNTFLLSGGTAVVSYSLSENDLLLAIDQNDGLEDVGALFETAAGDELVVADSGRGEFVVFTLSSATGLPGDLELDTFPFPDSFEDGLVREVVLSGDYAVAGTDRGELWVLTDAPWVEAIVTPVTAISGDELTVIFTSDTAGDWELRVGGEGDSDGELLESGSCDADEEIRVTTTVDSNYVEGSNPLRVVVTDSSGRDGHDVSSVVVDNPPGQVALSESNLGFGNHQLNLEFEGLDDADLASYTVYVSISPFEAADYESGGPAFDGDDALDDSDFFIAAVPGERVNKTLSPLTNGVVYYVAVRAMDAGGQEGPMSEVVSASPEETFGAAALSGEEGGFCGTAAPVSGLLVLLAGVFGAGRRRRTGVALAGLAALGLATGGNAQAAEERDISDKTVTRGTASFRAGPIAFDDGTITDVFGESGNEVLWIEVGPTVGRVLDLQLGLGWLQEMGWLLTADGAVSDEHDMLTALPITAGATLRLDVLEDQVLVPVIGAGGDFWLWRENWYVNSDVGGEDRLGGAKYGWHWAVGGQLLLDAFDAKRASKLQARTGIDDSYLAFEWRNQSVGDWQSGLDLGGSSWSLGLKVRY